MGIVTLLTAMFTNFNIVLPELLKLIATLRAYYIARDEREKAANQASIDSQILAATTQAKKEQANLKAFEYLLDAAWRIKYENLIENIRNGDEYLILKDLNGEDSEAVNNILFDSKSSIEYKASLVVKLLRR